MSFRHPEALLALLLLALPLWWHRRRRVALPPYSFSALFLLRRSESETRLRRWQDPLLLALRLALVALLVLLMADPQPPRATLPTTRLSLALVLDDSFSMRRLEGRESVWQRTLDRAQGEVAKLPPASECSLLLGGSPPRALAVRRPCAWVRKRLRALATHAPSRGDGLLAAYRQAQHIVDASSLHERRVLVLSDWAAHVDFPTSAAQPRQGMALRFERTCERAKQENAFIESALLEARSAGAGMRSLRVRLNPGRAERLVLRGSSGFSWAAASLSGQREIVLRLPEEALRAPHPAAWLELEGNDDLADDDRFPLLLREEPALQVWVLNGAPSANPNEDEVHRFMRALLLAPRERGRFQLRSVQAAELERLQADHADVLVLANVRSLDARLREQVLSFVEGGGGLFFTLGEQVEARRASAEWQALLPARLQPSLGMPTARPLWTEGAALALGSEASSLDGTRIQRYFPLSPLDKTAQSLFRLEAGTALWVWRKQGRGRVALLATTLDDAWNELPFRPGYLPWMSRFVRALAGDPRFPRRAEVPGTRLHLPRLAGVSVMEVIDPRGGSRVFTLERQAALNLDTQTEIGPYRVRVGPSARELHEERRLAFTLAAPPRESLLKPGRVPPSSTPPAGPGRIEQAASDTPSPYLPFLLFGLLLLWLGEAWMRPKAENRGSA